MPIFGRRQLQRMLDELGPNLSRAKATDLLKRLENGDAGKSLPAEYELACAWAVSQIAHIEIDKELGGRTPDIYSDDLLATGPIAGDVAAPSDEILADEPVMHRAANIIDGVCDRIVKGARFHLHYTFQEERGYLPPDRHGAPHSRYYRRRRISDKFKMEPALQDALRTWLADGTPTKPLRWETEHIDVTISWRERVHQMGKTFSSMPPEAHDLRANPLYRSLKRKSDQLRNSPQGTCRVIFLGDAGSSLLRNLNPVSSVPNRVSGKQIIQAFLADTLIDIVVVLSPKRVNENAPARHDNPLLWSFSIFSRSADMAKGDLERLQAIVRLLPPPQFSGYQARSLHKQRAFTAGSRGWYLGSHFTGGSALVTAKISARALQELVAGRIDSSTFEDCIFGKSNIFALQLARGRTISAVRFEAKGNDAEDDYIYFEFRDDPAAQSLRLPENLKR